MLAEGEPVITTVVIAVIVEQPPEAGTVYVTV